MQITSKSPNSTTFVQRSNKCNENIIWRGVRGIGGLPDMDFFYRAQGFQTSTPQISHCKYPPCRHGLVAGTVDQNQVENWSLRCVQIATCEECVQFVPQTCRERERCGACKASLWPEHVDDELSWVLSRLSFIAIYVLLVQMFEAELWCFVIESPSAMLGWDAIPLILFLCKVFSGTRADLFSVGNTSAGAVYVKSRSICTGLWCRYGLVARTVGQNQVEDQSLRQISLCKNPPRQDCKSWVYWNRLCCLFHSNRF